MVDLLKFAFNYKILNSVTLFKVTQYIYIYIYIYILPRFFYIVFFVFYTGLTHLAQKLYKKNRIDGTHGAKLNSEIQFLY